MFGTISSAWAWVLGTVSAEGLAEFTSSSFEAKGVCDVWYVDDGQSLVRPALFDSWLRALDMALLSFGATRGTLAEGNAKSSARLLCPPERRHEFQGWDTAYVRRTVQVLHPDDNSSALGASFGSLEHINAQVRQAVESSSELRQASYRCIMPPPKSFLPGSAQTSPNSPITCASMVIRWTTHCWPVVRGNVDARAEARVGNELARPLPVLSVSHLHHGYLAVGARCSRAPRAVASSAASAVALLCRDSRCSEYGCHSRKLFCQFLFSGVVPLSCWLARKCPIPLLLISMAEECPAPCLKTLGTSGCA